MIRAIVLHACDNVATLIERSEAKTVCALKGEQTGELELSGELPFGHKIALHEIKVGDEIIKYGVVIGRAIEDISVGAHVHVHNVESLRGRGDVAK